MLRTDVWIFHREQDECINNKNAEYRDTNDTKHDREIVEYKTRVDVHRDVIISDSLVITIDYIECVKI